MMLKKMLIGATALVSLVGASFAATGAEAYPWHGGWGWHGGYRGYGPGPVIGAGLLGVAIGATLAHPYYGPPPPYYAGPGYWGYYGDCRAYWRWDPHWGRYVRSEACY